MSFSAWLISIVSLVVLVPVSNAHEIGMFSTVDKNPKACVSLVTKVGNSVFGLPTSKDWKIYVVCDEPSWVQLKRRYKAEHTQTAFSLVKNHITFVRGSIFITRNFGRPEFTMAHELAHILGTEDELKADQQAEQWLSIVTTASKN